MTFRELQVGDFFHYPLTKTFEKYDGVWMKTCLYFEEDPPYYVNSVCVYGAHVGVLMDHEKDELWDNAEVIKLNGNFYL